ncbi:MAG: IS1 family transposase [Phycisphaerales bacterium]|nr:IS1 family transposase [Phycisphaerales bacterium]
MRKLSTEKRAMILHALVEGNSINATSRLCGCSKITVLRLLADAGTFCAEYHDEHVRNLQCERVQMDEIWSFVGCKDKAIKAGAGGHGSVWTWVAIDADTKMVVSYLMGERNQESAQSFVSDVRDRIDSRIQLSSDGFGAYREAVYNAFCGSVDFAIVIKEFGWDGSPDTRYSPAKCVGIKKRVLCGTPDEKHVSTSLVERQNLTLRMGSRRFTRLTNAFSKKVENHAHAIALHYFYYNFCRKHQTIKTAPAVAMGIADRQMTILDLVKLIEAEESRLGRRITDYLPAVDSK